MNPLVIIGIFQTLILAGTIYIVWKQISTSRNAQRAWVTVEIEQDVRKRGEGEIHIIMISGTGGDKTAIDAVLVCKNEGSSPGWIDEKRVKFEIVSSLPPRPNLESATSIQVGPIPIGTRPCTDIWPFTPVAVGHQEHGKMLVIYGVVKYRDIFDKRRETTFAYEIGNGKLARLEGYPEYNKNT